MSREDTASLPKYVVMEDVAIADVAYRVVAGNLDDLFSTAAKALCDVMVETESIQQKVQKDIELEGESLEELLYDFLSTLIFLKDAENLLFNHLEVHVEKGERWRLEARCWGEEIDVEKHGLRSDVKAVTYHMFEVREEDGRWTAQIVLDI